VLREAAVAVSPLNGFHSWPSDSTALKRGVNGSSPPRKLASNH
jgi:hypothetical protein